MREWRRLVAFRVAKKYSRELRGRRAAAAETPRMAPIACLSVRQPWADLILSGVKDLENRSWHTRHRGILLIHAPQAVEDTPDVREYIADQGASWPIGCEQRTSAVLGAVLMSECVAAARMPLRARWAVGPYCFVLRRPVMFERPVQRKGQQGLFWIEAEAFGATQLRQIFSVIA